jgi:hypothetical protein
MTVLALLFHTRETVLTMSTASIARLTGRHVIGAAALVLPLYFLLIGIQDTIQGTAAGHLGHRLTTAGFYYLVYVLPVAGGAGVHLWVTRAALGRQSSLAQRVGSILLTVILPLAVRLTGESTESLLGYPVPLVVTLIVYGVLTPLGGHRGTQAAPATRQP